MVSSSSSIIYKNEKKSKTHTRRRRKRKIKVKLKHVCKKKVKILLFYTGICSVRKKNYTHTHSAYIHTEAVVFNWMFFFFHSILVYCVTYDSKTESRFAFLHWVFTVSWKIVIAARLLFLLLLLLLLLKCYQLPLLVFLHL